MPGRADRAVAVVIPAYQAAATIAEVVSRTSRAVPGATVYVVDDGSTDGTSGAGSGQGATVLVHARNRGKGAALATGIAAALEGGADVIITLDADGQHPPEEIPGLAAPVLAGAADVTLGARARSGAMPWGRRCTNWLSAALASRIAGTGVPDAQSGFRALSRRAAHAVRPGDHFRGTMNILISNDDGILARGLAVLGEVCAALAQVTVVAPDREQSGTSHSLTLHRPLHATRRPDGAFQVDGTPTDCVLLAIDMLMPQKPDFVISGINHGQNMGEDVFYSGTVAAAMEGLVAGIPSIAVSYAGGDLDVLETHKDGLRSLLKRIVEVKDFPKETLLNINLPALPGDQVKGVKVTHLGSRVFSEEIALMKDPWGKEIYWIGGGRITWSGDADSDFRATSDGYISVTPLHMDMTNYDLIEVVWKWLPGD